MRLADVREQIVPDNRLRNGQDFYELILHALGPSDVDAYRCIYINS
jgi:hypothetical protein